MAKTLRISTVALSMFAFAATAMAQDGVNIKPTAGVRTLSIDTQGNRTGPSSRYGNFIWDNSAHSGWFNPWEDEYIQLDWGKLQDQGNGLPNEVIDGFLFGYATDATGTVDHSQAGVSYRQFVEQFPGAVGRSPVGDNDLVWRDCLGQQ